MADEVLGNVFAELRKRGDFGGFSEERMQLVLEVMGDKVDYALKDSLKMAGQLEDFSDSKVIQILLNGRTFKYTFGGGRFHMLPQSYNFSHGLCLNNLLQVWLIGHQRYQVPPFGYINWEVEVSRLVRGSKVIGDMKYLMVSVKRAEEASVLESTSRSILPDLLYFLVLENKVFLPYFYFFIVYENNFLFSSFYYFYLKYKHGLLQTL